MQSLSPFLAAAAVLALFGPPLLERAAARYSRISGLVAVGLGVAWVFFRGAESQLDSAVSMPLLAFGLGAVGLIAGLRLRTATFAADRVNVLRTITATSALTLIVGAAAAYLSVDALTALGAGHVPVLPLALAAAAVTVVASAGNVLRLGHAHPPLATVAVSLEAVGIVVVGASLCFWRTGVHTELGLSPVEWVVATVAAAAMVGMLLRPAMQQLPELGRQTAWLGAIVALSGAAMALHLSALLAGLVVGLVQTGEGSRRALDDLHPLERPIHLMVIVLAAVRCGLEAPAAIGVLAACLVVAQLLAKIAGGAWSLRLQEEPFTWEQSPAMALLAGGALPVAVALSALPMVGLSGGNLLLGAALLFALANEGLMTLFQFPSDDEAAPSVEADRVPHADPGSPRHLEGAT